MIAKRTKGRIIDGRKQLEGILIQYKFPEGSRPNWDGFIELLKPSGILSYEIYRSKKDENVYLCNLSFARRKGFNIQRKFVVGPDYLGVLDQNQKKIFGTYFGNPNTMSFDKDGYEEIKKFSNESMSEARSLSEHVKIVSDMKSQKEITAYINNNNLNDKAYEIIQNVSIIKDIELRGQIYLHLRLLRYLRQV